MNKKNNRYQGSRSKGVSVVPSARKNALPASRTRECDESPLISQIFKNSLLGLAAFSISGLILVTVMGLLAYMSPDPDSLIAPLALLALMPSGFVGGLVTAKKTGQSPFACGIICGAMVTLAMLVLSLCLYGAPSSNYAFWQYLILHACAIGFCVLGAFTGNMKRKFNPKKRRFGN